MLKVENCPMCESEHLEVIDRYQFALPKTKEYDKSTNDLSFKYKRLSILFEKILQGQKQADFDIDLCNSCGLIFSNPRLTDEEIKIKYQAIDEFQSNKSRPRSRLAAQLDRRAKRIYSLLSKSLKHNSKPLKVLDYGGAGGYNLVPFIEASNSCYLVDYVKQDLPQGVEYLGKDISDLKPDDLFDMILFCHTLEHVIAPKEIVKELSAHLTAGGILYVEVPLGGYDEWKRLSEPITHINFFSEESASKCLRSAGLDIVHLSTACQWVTHNDFWCVNVVGSKRQGNTVTKFKTTREQMKPRLFEHPKYYLKKINRKLQRLPNKVLQVSGLVKSAK